MPRALPSHLLKVEGDAGSQLTIKGGVSALYFSIMLNLKRGEGEVLRGVCCITSKTLKAEENLTYLSLSLSFPPLLRILYPFTELRSFPYCRWMGYIVRGWTPSLSPFFFSLSFSQGNLKTHWLALHKSPAGDIDPLVWIAIGSMRECHQ